MAETAVWPIPFLNTFAALKDLSFIFIYYMFPWYKYLIVKLVFFPPRFCSGNFFLIAPFFDPCLLLLSWLSSDALWKKKNTVKRKSVMKI